MDAGDAAMWLADPQDVNNDQLVNAQDLDDIVNAIGQCRKARIIRYQRGRLHR